MRQLLQGELAEKKRQQARSHYAANREKLRAQTAVYRAANPDKVKAMSKRYLEENRETIYAKNKAWRQANKELVKERNREYREQDRHAQIARERSRQWRIENQEWFRQSVSRWQKANPGKLLAYSRSQKAFRRQRVPSWADHDAIAMVYQLAEIAKVTWPELDIHIDHALPLGGRTVSGLHVHRNLQLLTAQANLAKGNAFELG